MYFRNKLSTMYLLFQFSWHDYFLTKVFTLTSTCLLTNVKAPQVYSCPIDNFAFALQVQA